MKLLVELEPQFAARKPVFGVEAIAHGQKLVCKLSQAVVVIGLDDEIVGRELVEIERRFHHLGVLFEILVVFLR